MPVLGICLGHQLLALATGRRTFKLPFGHRGANHPVLERATGRVLVTSQNHGFAVEAADDGRRRRTSRSTTAPSRGSTFPELRARSVQFHPEAAPGPHDAWPVARAAGSRSCAMPRSDDLHSICLIGSGPIVIGQACEFDYAGCQALKVLREDGFRTIVVNSNPATIMTDPGFADRTYLEPLDLEGVAGVLERERPDALLPTMGGRTALEPRARSSPRRACSSELGIELIGAPLDVIDRAEDRELFRDAVERVRPEDAELADRHLARRPRRRRRRPAVVRPAFTLGGHGGGFAETAERAARARSSSACARARSARCSSRSRCAAGTSSSSRSSATAPTTS